MNYTKQQDGSLASEKIQLYGNLFPLYYHHVLNQTTEDGTHTIDTDEHVYQAFSNV